MLRWTSLGPRSVTKMSGDDVSFAEAVTFSLTLAGGSHDQIQAGFAALDQAGLTPRKSACHPAAVSGNSLMLLRTPTW